jgi:hypothetical protein
MTDKTKRTLWNVLWALGGLAAGLFIKNPRSKLIAGATQQVAEAAIEGAAAEPAPAPQETQPAK